MGTQLKVTLYVSLAINLLLIGMVGGYLVRGCPRRPPPFPPPPELAQKLSPEHAELFSKAMDSLHEKNRKNAEALDQTRNEVLEILTAKDFDAKAFQDKMKQLHDRHGDMQGQLTQTVAELASKLSQEERKALAQILKRGPLNDGPPGGPPPLPPGPPPGFAPPPPPGGAWGPPPPPPDGIRLPESRP